MSNRAHLTKERAEPIPAATQREYLECTECGEKFSSRSEANFHVNWLGHVVLDYQGLKTAN